MQRTIIAGPAGRAESGTGSASGTKGRKQVFSSASRARWSRIDAAIFSRQFSHLLAAGVSVTDGLQELAAMEPQPRVRLALFDIRSRVLSGLALSEAISCYPRLFPAEYIAAVQAGERGGQLANCFEQLAEHLQWVHGSISRLKTALSYPLFALCFLFVAVLFVLLYLVPAMLPFLRSIGDMPELTRVIIAASILLQVHGLDMLALAVSVILPLGLLRLLYTPCALFFDRLLLSGAFGNTLLQISVARYARVLSLLYQGGVSLTDAMALAENVIRNRALRSDMCAARNDILSGSTLSQAMQRRALPRLFIRMVHAGEKAGVLGTGLYQAAVQLQMNGQYRLDRAERLIGPWLLCLLGGVLILLVLAVLGPVYNSLNMTGVAL